VAMLSIFMVLINIPDSVVGQKRKYEVSQMEYGIVPLKPDTQQLK
jgi:hypothetical protein